VCADYRNGAVAWAGIEIGWHEPNTLLINRLAPIPGVLSYQLDA